MLTLPIVAGRRYVRRDGVTVTAQPAGPYVREEFLFVGVGTPNGTGFAEHVYPHTGRVSYREREEYPFDLVADALTLPLVIGTTYRTRGGFVGVLRASRRGGPDIGVLKECCVSLATGRVESEGVEDEYDVVEGPLGTAPAETAGHPHAARMLQYAQDAAETDKPWERWDYRSPDIGRWASCSSNPKWRTHYSYRRKPTTRTVTLTLPEPLRTAPPGGTRVWLADVVVGRVVCITWTGNEPHQPRWLAAGLLYATESEATQVREALLGALQ